MPKLWVGPYIPLQALKERLWLDAVHIERELAPLHMGKISRVARVALPSGITMTDGIKKIAIKLIEGCGAAEEDTEGCGEFLTRHQIA